MRAGEAQEAISSLAKQPILSEYTSLGPARRICTRLNAEGNSPAEFLPTLSLQLQRSGWTIRSGALRPDRGDLVLDLLPLGHKAVGPAAVKFGLRNGAAPISSGAQQPPLVEASGCLGSLVCTAEQATAAVPTATASTPEWEPAPLPAPSTFMAWLHYASGFHACLGTQVLLQEQEDFHLLQALLGGGKRQSRLGTPSSSGTFSNANSGSFVQQQQQHLQKHHSGALSDTLDTSPGRSTIWHVITWRQCSRQQMPACITHHGAMLTSAMHATLPRRPDSSQHGQCQRRHTLVPAPDQRSRQPAWAT
jgi:hypothetical protein